MAGSEDPQHTNASVAPFVTSLLFNLGLAGAFYIAYIVVRRLDRSIYEPRTYLVDKEKQPPKLSSNPMAWLIDVYRTPDKVLLKRIGLDAYVFVRFIRLCFFLFSIFTALSLVILLPINYTGGGGLTGLDRFNIGNVKQPSKLWAHVILNYIFTGVTLYFMSREMSIYLRLRQRHLMSHEHQSNPVATTILVTGIPDELNNKEKLTEVFSVFPGGVKNAYINRDASELQKKVVLRQQILEKLEQAESNYIMASLKDPTKTPMRPTHRLSWIPFKGPKVDSIEYYKQELAQLNEEILEQQQDPTKFPRKASAFITFHSQIAAHFAVQALAHNKPLVMEGRYLEVDPNEVIWENLNMFSPERYIRKGLAVACGTALIILWFFPVAAVTMLFKLETLDSVIHGLHISDWNPVIRGILQGILPSLGMSILMALLPIILAFLSRFEGLVRNSDIQLAVMDKYFIFLVVNVLIYATLAIGTLGVLYEIVNEPLSIPSRLGVSVPTASVFYMTYVMLHGISGGAKELLQAVAFVLRFVLTSLLPKTPRKLTKLKSMPQIEWGTFFPQHTFVYVLGMVYATISPILLIFVTAYFLIFYFVFHHQFQYVYDCSNFQSGGLLLPKAMHHMFAGLYIYHLTMAGVVLAKRAYPQFGMQIALLGITIIAHLYGARGFEPLVKYLPINVVTDPALIGLTDKQEHISVTHEMSLSSDSSLINMHQLDEKPHSITKFENYENRNAHTSSAQSTLSFGTQMSKRKIKLPPVYNQGPDSVFLHSALREPVPVVWLPKDTLGIADREAYSFAKAGQPATTEGSILHDANGKISVSVWTPPVLVDSNLTSP